MDFRGEIWGRLKRMSENEAGKVTLRGDGRGWMGGIEEGVNTRELGRAVIRDSRATAGTGGAFGSWS